MNQGQSSHTADRVAARRAAHRILDAPLIFDDPLAFAILRSETAARVRANPQEFNRSSWSKFLRAVLVARSRFAEDALRDAVGRGVGQYVVLGAGYDTFACRSPFPTLRVFEVDHPATQAAKRRRLADAGIAIPPTATFVPIDFAQGSLADALAAAGFDTSEPAFFSWLGVVYYLERDAIVETLRYVAARPPGSAIVFDYGLSPSRLGWFRRLMFRGLARRVASVGEPWKTFFVPEEIAALLTGLGFSAVEDAGPGELNTRYFSGRADGLRVGGMSHIVRAMI